MGQSEHVIFIQITAAIAEWGEFFKQCVMILRAVHFNEENRVLIAKQPLGPMKDARMCVGAFSSPSSTCCHGQSAGTIRSSAASKSRATAGSACSLIVTPAVVCGT